MPPQKKVDQLTDDEIEAFRSMLESDRRVRWAWSTLRAWAIGVGAVVAGLTIGFDALAKMVKWLATGK